MQYLRFTVLGKGVAIFKLSYLSIESHFDGVHGRYELHRKEEQIKCTALAVHENLLFFPMPDAVHENLLFFPMPNAVHENLLFFPMQFISPVNTDKMRFNTYIYIFLQQSLSRYCLF